MRVGRRALLLGALALAACAPAPSVDPILTAPDDSPLYRAELTRRGRSSLPRPSVLWAESERVVDFTRAASVVDDHGFEHRFYTGLPKRTDADGPTTLWRVDLDPRGRMVWAEPVRLFGGAALEPVATGDVRTVIDVARLRLPPRQAALTPRHVTGFRSPRGDGYYALELFDPAAARPTDVVFFTLDESGYIVPEYWSYGADLPGARRFAPDREDMPPDDRELLKTYLLSLAGPNV